MQYTTFGKTGLRVSVAGLGTGGFSRLGLKSGKTEAEAARLIEEAAALGINFIDTAPAYGTEGVVGRALKTIPRSSVVIAGKASIRGGADRFSPARMVESLDNSLRAMGTDYLDVFNLHAVEPHEYAEALDKLAPAMLKEKEKGKIRHIGLTENPIVDFTNGTLKRALNDPVWEVYMVGFHMLHQGARDAVFARAREKGVGTLLMFAVRSIFADPPRIAREMKALAAKGLVESWLGETDDPLGFLIREGGAATITEAAYRFARHDSGADVILFGTGNIEHLRTNIAALEKPPLPQPCRDKIKALFGRLDVGVGLDSHLGPGATR